jgi:CubicO group peptidase (beta-lactamase class C family)
MGVNSRESTITDSCSQELAKDEGVSIMRKRKRVVLVSVLILAVLFAVASFWGRQRATPRKPDPIPPGDYTYTVEYAAYRIDQLMRQHHLPSVAVALIDDQDTIWQQAFGLANVERDIPAQVGTVYKLWSVAKVFTAIETMRLVEEGLVDLDAPITDYLPDFSIHSRFPDAAPITIRSILAHRSGLPRNECHSLMSGPEDDDVLGEMVASLKHCHWDWAGKPPVFSVRSYWSGRMAALVRVLVHW